MLENPDNIISIKELAAKLKVSDAFLKKIIKDFGIETQRVQKRMHFDENSVRTIREIMALRASGKKNQEIKELFEASKAPEKKLEAPEKDVTKTEQETIAKEEEEETKKQVEPTQKQEQKKEFHGDKPNFKYKQKKDKFKPTTREDEKKEDSQEQPSESNIDISYYLETEEAEASIEEELPHENENTFSALDEFDEDTEKNDDFDDSREADDKMSPRKVRRRQFSYKYIQRQIANDSKRISYIKQKLKRGRLSVKEKMNLEDSLYYRSMLLSGWMQLLRWVKS